ncbi:hypothetical protein ABZ370_33920 [Streptomyces sp. NPDC005962]|uniref:hypothetical protein n=1 Tax=Streptomyces sp. NPDC005962 TaxID=3154466 RepID=UPI0033EF7E03
MPTLCTIVITASAEAAGSVRDVASGEVVRDVLLGGMPVAEARTVARALAHFEQPELRVAGAGLPDRVSPLSPLDLESVTGTAVGDRWKKRVPALRVSAILGVSERGLFTVDLSPVAR